MRWVRLRILASTTTGARADINRRIGVQSSSDKPVKKLSMLVTAHAIARQPQTQVIGEYREDAGDALRVWEREIERIYRLYRVPRVKASEYEEIDESERYFGG